MIRKPETKLATKTILKWTAGAVAALVLAFVAYRVFDPAKSPLAADTQRAQAQVDHGDYATGLKAFSDLIEKHPRNKALRSARVDGAMLWIRNYHIAGAEGKDVAGPANAELSPLIAMLEAESAGVNGAQAATLAAHLGWAHFLRFKIAEADMMESAEPYFRQALRLNSRDVYANSMLGNWLLQTKSDAVNEAIGHFLPLIPMNEGENAAPCPARGDALQPFGGRFAEIGRKIGDHEEVIFLRHTPGLLIVFRDARVLVAQIHLDDFLDVLAEFSEALLDLVALRPDAPADQRLLVIGDARLGELRAQPLLL